MRLSFEQCPANKKLFTLLDSCVSSLRRGHANLLCVVPILTDDPRRESTFQVPGAWVRDHCVRAMMYCCSNEQFFKQNIWWQFEDAKLFQHAMVYCCSNEQFFKQNIWWQFEDAKLFQLGGVTPSCHPSGGWLVKCWYLHYVLLIMLMACPDQVGTQQGQRSESCDVLVDNDMGIGSGWQQSRQNRAVSSVVGK
jgi:hypothetical protein